MALCRLHIRLWRLHVEAFVTVCNLCIVLYGLYGLMLITPRFFVVRFIDYVRETLIADS